MIDTKNKNKESEYRVLKNASTSPVSECHATAPTDDGAISINRVGVKSSSTVW